MPNLPFQKYAPRLPHSRSTRSASAIAGVALAAILASAPALAEGGLGGQSGGSGSAGGPDNTSVGGTGGTGANTPGAAGGGGGAGETGGDGGNAVNGGLGGAGGLSAGGTGIGGSGGAGSDDNNLGGGGGGGGAHGYVGATVPASTAGSLFQGGAGGAGGDGTFTTANGGGGGAGGYGVVLDGPVTGTLLGTITGGAGGAGGDSGGPLSDSGNGGTGGIGLYFGGPANVTFTGTVAGGTGGDGGAGDGLHAYAGAGGDAIFAADALELTLGTGTSVTGGFSGVDDYSTPVQANAITFATGFSNVLTLHSGVTISGNVVADGDDTLQFGGTTAGSFNVEDLGATEQFQGFAFLKKVDASTWTLSGTNTDTYDVEVLGGTLVFDAQMSNTTMTVRSGGTLAGTGSMDVLTVFSGGVHAPGTSQTTGAYVMQSGSTLRIGVDAAGNNSQVIVTNQVTLLAATLEVIAAAGSYSPTTEYTIIDNQSLQPVVGTFGDITSNLAFLIPTVVYDGGDGNDVVLTLTLTGNSVDFCSVAKTQNECNVAKAAQKLGEGNPIYDAILVQSAAGARQAFNAMSGEVHATISSTLANDSHYVRDIILGRLAQAYYARSSGGTQTAALISNGPTATAGLDGAPMMGLGMGGDRPDPEGYPRTVSPITFWTQGYGAWGDFDGNGNAAGANRTLGGFLSGMDAMMNDNWRVGAALGYARSDVSVGNGRFSSADIDGYQLAAYTSGTVGAFVVRGGVVWSWNSIDTGRAIIFPGFAENVGASYNGNTGQVFGEVALPLAHADVAYEPFANLAWVGVDTGGFTETGGNAALTSNGAYDSVGYMTLGARAAGSMFVYGTEVIPHGSLAWLHAFGSVDPSQGLAFASFGQSMVTYGVPLAQDSALINAGVDVRMDANAVFGLSYTGQFADKVQDNAITGRLDWRF